VLISHKYKFLTIDIPKTGTKTIRETLVGSFDFVGKGKNQHMGIKKCKNFFIDNGLPFEDYFKFSIVRNPWSRYVSFCSYIFDRVLFCENHMDSLDEKSEPYKRLMRQYNCYINLIDKAGKDRKKLIKNLIKTIPTQYDFLKESDGSVQMDMIATTENLNEDIKIFCEKVGIKDSLKISHANKSSRSEPIKNYYTQELIDMVAEKESWVIEKFGYNFRE
jgi:hypothetical protein